MHRDYSQSHPHPGKPWITRVAIASIALFGWQITVLESESAPLQATMERTDPAIILPAPHQLPAGYVYRPQPNETSSTPLVRSVLHEYERACDDQSKRATHLSVRTLIAINQGRAATEFDQRVTSLAQGGWSIEPADGLLGDQTIIGRRAIASDAAGPREEITVFFRSGYTAGGATIEDYVGMPNLEQALEIAALIKGNVLALQTTIDRDVAAARSGEGLPPLDSSGRFRWPAWTAVQSSPNGEPVDSAPRTLDAPPASCGCLQPS